MTLNLLIIKKVKKVELNDITVSIYSDKIRKQQALVIWVACILIIVLGKVRTSPLASACR